MGFLLSTSFQHRIWIRIIVTTRFAHGRGRQLDTQYMNAEGATTIGNPVMERKVPLSSACAVPLSTTNAFHRVLKTTLKNAAPAASILYPSMIISCSVCAAQIQTVSTTVLVTRQDVASTSNHTPNLSFPSSPTILQPFTQFPGWDIGLRATASRSSRNVILGQASFQEVEDIFLNGMAAVLWHLWWVGSTSRETEPV